MNVLRQLRNFWIPLVTMIVLACFSNAVAQTRYEVKDLGAENGDNLGMTMGLNNHGASLIMDQVVVPSVISQNSTTPAGTVRIAIDGRNIDLQTLGGKNSSINWGGINDNGEAVGLSETSGFDPNGEDVCGFGTGATCLPFLWRNGQMSALPTLGGNNGQASAINNRGQVTGYSETAVADSGCPFTPVGPTAVPVLWDKGQAQALPRVSGDPDGVAFGINDLGQAVGYSGNCAAAVHAVIWADGTVIQLPDNGPERSNVAYAINNQGQIVGKVRAADNSTYHVALWQCQTPSGLPPVCTLKDLGTLGQHSGFATSINSKGQVVGSFVDSLRNWSGGFIYQDGVMTDLNTLFPTSNLSVISASNINDRGQISGMALVTSGPDQGNVHAFLATPVDNGGGE